MYSTTVSEKNWRYGERVTDVKVAIVGKTTMIVSDGEDHKRRICIRASVDGHSRTCRADRQPTTRRCTDADSRTSETAMIPIHGLRAWQGDE